MRARHQLENNNAFPAGLFLLGWLVGVFDPRGFATLAFAARFWEESSCQ